LIRTSKNNKKSNRLSFYAYQNILVNNEKFWNSVPMRSVRKKESPVYVSLKIWRVKEELVKDSDV
jgi:hypothetical protein